MDPRVIDKKLQILQELATQSVVPITAWQARTAEHVAPGEYRYEGGWSRIAVPARFPAGKTVFLKAQAAVPASVTVADSYLSFGFQDMEGMLSIDGKPYAGLDANHLRVPSPARGRHVLEAEFMSVPGVYCQPGLAGHFGVFASASLVAVNRQIETFCREVRFAFETARVSDDPRRKPLLEAARSAGLMVQAITCSSLAMAVADVNFMAGFVP